MKHENLPAPALPVQDIAAEVLAEKYCKGNETTAQEIFLRVADALASVESESVRPEMKQKFIWAMENGFVPAGRIASAAGTGIQATLINCFVQPVGDSIATEQDGYPGIYTALTEAAETMRRGGGVGYDFSRIRPRGASVGSTQSSASGPVSYMRVFDRSCETVESAGSRRGAQMGVLRCDHPDIEEFIHAKDKGDMRNFNISVGVTDQFMLAVANGGEVELTHKAEPGKAQIEAGAYRKSAETWVYRKVAARDLWDQIMKCTYTAAEPGVLFLDRMNEENNLWYCEKIEATNPCVTADTWVMTSNGPRQVSSLIGENFDAVVDGRPFKTLSKGFFRTGTKPVFRLETVEGHSLRLTEDHRVLRVKKLTRYVRHAEWVAAKDLGPEDMIVVHNHENLLGWPGKYGANEGYLMGALLGDGTLTKERAVFKVWDTSLVVDSANQTIVSKGTKGIMQAIESAARTHAHRRDFKGWHAPVLAENKIELKSAAARDLAFELGMSCGNKGITPQMEQCSSDFCCGLLRGLFDADGSVQGSQAKGISVRLTQADVSVLEAVQRILLRLGIASAIYRNRRAAGVRPMPDGHGGRKLYHSMAVHELIIAGSNLFRYASKIGFADTAKTERLEKLLASYVREPNRERFVARVKSLVSDGVETVYDVTVDDVHAFDANGLYVHNCAEEPLPPYGCCDLGSVNLTRFVNQPFSEAASFDFDLMASVAGVGVRMLDNVLDVTFWPLEQQRLEAQAKRRIGLGYLGLGDTLVMLGLRYDSIEGREFAAGITERLRNATYMASVELAKERGAFPVFDAKQYMASKFVQRIEGFIAEQIEKHGIRNSHLLAIAPTGTITLAFADNASNGIEPAFSWTYNRKKRMADGSSKDFPVEDHAYRLYRAMHPDAKELPSQFVTALEMSADAHLRMLEAVQPYVDTSISKTVNVPEDYPFEDFQNLYMDAWNAKLKGLATYRPNSVLGSVLSVPLKADQATAAKSVEAEDPDRRVRLDALPEVISALPYPSRPTFGEGNMAWSFMMEVPGVIDAGLFVGQDASNMPFEAWVNGVDQPRGLGAIAKVFSIDMRAGDRKWLEFKLQKMVKAVDAVGFDAKVPGSDQKRHFPGVVPYFAHLVSDRCSKLGAFDNLDGVPTPLMDSLLFRKEQKSRGAGTLSWTWDVRNERAGDDFTIFIKEMEMPDGAVRPYSLWLSGNYPKAFDGLCKLLSIDMWVHDPAWVGLKLKKLLNYSEAELDFMHWVPGNGKQAHYSSSIAYIAHVVLYRYKVLGLLDGDGNAIRGGLVTSKAVEGVVPEGTPVLKGAVCPECGSHSLAKVDGCTRCTSCGYTGSCG